MTAMIPESAQAALAALATVIVSIGAVFVFRAGSLVDGNVAKAIYGLIGFIICVLAPVIGITGTYWLFHPTQ